jgi:hypothetical protein
MVAYRSGGVTVSDTSRRRANAASSMNPANVGVVTPAAATARACSSSEAVGSFRPRQLPKL